MQTVGKSQKRQTLRLLVRLFPSQSDHQFLKISVNFIIWMHAG